MLHATSYKPQGRAGFTLIELLIVVVIIAAVTTIVLGALARFNRTQALIAAAEGSVALLSEARTLTLASKNANVYGVHFATSSVTRFTGSLYSEGASDNEVYMLPASVEITDIKLGGGSDVVFERLTGKADTAGTVTFTLTADATKTRVVTINIAGIVEVE